MQIAIEKNTGVFRTWAGAEVATLTRRRTDAESVDIRILDGTTRMQLANGATGSVLIKAQNAFSGPSLAGALNWTTEGNGAERIYKFWLDLDTVAMRALFADGKASVSLVMQVTWKESPSASTTTLAIPLLVQNVYVEGEEGLPALPPPLLTNIGNENFRFGETGQPEWYVEALGGWVREYYVGSPPEKRIELL